MASQTTSLKPGCYLIRFHPTYNIENIDYFEGTLRVEQSGPDVIATGDLYFHEPNQNGKNKPKPLNEIPIFPIPNYSHWLHVTGINPNFDSANSLTARFEPHRFDPGGRLFINRGAFEAVLTPETPPREYPNDSAYFVGKVVEKDTGIHVGDLTLGWISEQLRRAAVEIDCVDASIGTGAGTPVEPPLSNGAAKPVGWEQVFGDLGWEFSFDKEDSETDLPEPPPDLKLPNTAGYWTEAELHQQLLYSRAAATDLDDEWHYYLLCVRRITSQDRGVMFDVGGTDSDKMPREGAAVAAGWVFPDEDPWGTNVKDKVFGLVQPAYFRAAVHEIGHSMGLDHNLSDNGFMNTTDAIAENDKDHFPANIQFSFAQDDATRLRHGPDICIRPGGVAFAGGNSVFPDTKSLGDAAATAAQKGFSLRAAPLVLNPGRRSTSPDHRDVPLGAPVRIQFDLKWNGEKPPRIPKNLNLRSGHLRGRVIDPEGKVRRFGPVVKCFDDETRLQIASSSPNRSESVTLWRGPDGALFPMPGFYRIIIEISWEERQPDIIGNTPVAAIEYLVQGETTVRVLGPEELDPNYYGKGPLSTQTIAYAKFAKELLEEPETWLCLAIGGDHLVKGNRLIQTGVSDAAYQVLKPHLAYIEAKRLVQRHFGQADPSLACQYIDAQTVMTPSECVQFIGLIRDALRGYPDKGTGPTDIEDPTVKDTVNMLIERLDDLKADEATKMAAAKIASDLGIKPPLGVTIPALVKEAKEYIASKI